MVLARAKLDDAGEFKLPPPVFATTATSIQGAAAVAHGRGRGMTKPPGESTALLLPSRRGAPPSWPCRWWLAFLGTTTLLLLGSIIWLPAVATPLRNDEGLNEPAPYDVVIVGAGPSGSIIARTLAEASPNTRVLLIEAGGGSQSVLGGKDFMLHDQVRGRVRSSGS